MFQLKMSLDGIMYDECGAALRTNICAAGTSLAVVQSNFPALRQILYQSHADLVQSYEERERAGWMLRRCFDPQNSALLF